MREHLEIIMPPVDNVKSAIKEVMEPFREHAECNNSLSFWDYWVLGGDGLSKKMPPQDQTHSIDHAQCIHTLDIYTIMQLKDINPELVASRVIIAAKNPDGTLEARYMAQEDFWNGINHANSAWDRKVKSAIDEYVETLSSEQRSVENQCIPKDDWIVVTVDCHS